MNTRPIIIVYLMVAVFFSGCIEEDDPNYHLVTVNIASPEIAFREVGGSLVWDAMFEVNKVTPKDIVVPFDELTVHVIHSEGSGDPTILPLEAGPIVHDGQLHAWYIPSPGGGKGLTNADVTHLTGLTGDHVMSYVTPNPNVDYPGCRFDLFLQEHRVGDLWLPIVFTEMSESRISLNESSGVALWDVELTVEVLTPMDRGIPWSELVLRVIDERNHLVLFTTEPEHPPYDPLVPFYSDALGDDTLGVGDTLFIRGMDSSYQGCKLSLTWGGGWLGSGWGVYDVRLPLTFE